MAPPPDRRTLAELRTLYELSEETRDVVVEGASDAELINWYLRQHDVAHHRVYPVDDRAHVPSELVIQHGAEVGARGRVWTLAKESTQWALARPNLTCILDSDWDCLTEGSDDVDGLVKTDFATIDVYAFSSRPLQKLLDLVLSRDVEAQSVIDRLTPALNTLFLCRHVLHTSGLGVSITRNIAACTDFRSDPVVVNTPEVFRRSVNIPGVGRASIDELVDRVDQAASQLPTDRRRAIRGGDLPPMLIGLLSLRNEWARPETLHRAWRACLVAEDLDVFPMFAALRQRLSS